MDRFTSVVATVVAAIVLVASWWLVGSFFDHANYKGCEQIGLCKTVTLARLAKDTGVNIDAQGSITFPPRVVQTVTQPAPIIVQQPAPQPIIVQVPPVTASTSINRLPGRSTMNRDGTCTLHYSDGSTAIGRPYGGGCLTGAH